MKNRRILSHVFPVYATVVLLILSIFGWHGYTLLVQTMEDHLRTDLEVRGRLVEDALAPYWKPLDIDSIDTKCKVMAGRTGTRISVILRDGRVIGESDTQTVYMDDHSQRPEVREAFQGNNGFSIRRSFTLKTAMMYVALPVRQDSTVTAVIRTALPLDQVEQLRQQLTRSFVVYGIAGIVVVWIVMWWGIRTITKPLADFSRGAEMYLRGRFESRFPSSRYYEIDALAKTLNTVAEEITERIATITRQRNELEAVLSSMVEGVVAVDCDQRLIKLNQAAANLMEVDPGQVIGKTVHEVLRNSELLEIVERANMAGGNPVEGEMVLRENGHQYYLQVHGTALKDSRGKLIGVLLVLNDVTHLRRLESIRKEFVANVSHEIKTPITSIKGFVETLQDGALEDPVEAQRFLAIVARQADRLNSIVEDLLCLSRIEQEQERGEIATAPTNLNKLLYHIEQDCQQHLEQKNIEVVIETPKDLMFPLNQQLFEQAIMNLLDNAIKYSDPETKVWLRGRLQGEGTLCVEVEDQGYGIAPQHIDRLFERFYRVDKARSRQEGGTGLGLAITKHIVRAHHGTIVVHSEVGQGSLFRITIPPPVR